MKSAVIKTGGKQFLVSEGDTIKIEKVTENADEKLAFKDVLLTATDKTAKIGNPLVKGATVEARVIEQSRHAKIHGVKMKPKKRYRRYFGHQQRYTKVEIVKIKTR